MNLFEIKNMRCAYHTDNVVLEVSDLCIPMGKIVFFVGPSGIGKSTILETLGFMNQTVVEAEVFRYHGQDVRMVWNWKDAKLSSFRKREFAFVFQQCNLMPNFTAYENVMITGLLQGMPYEQVRRKTRDLFAQMGIPYNQDRPIYQYSGGQQQRIAFARAILPQFNVLFGDEPTGNLDAHSAETLMRMLVQAVRSKENGASAIIVSHDMHLATTYADQIIQIQHTEHSYGVINESSRYERVEEQKWVDSNASYTTTELYDKLMQEV